MEMEIWVKWVTSILRKQKESLTEVVFPTVLPRTWAIEYAKSRKQFWKIRFFKKDLKVFKKVWDIYCDIL